MARQHARRQRVDPGLLGANTQSPSLANIQTLVNDDAHQGGRAAVDYYFIQDDGGMLCVKR